MARTGAFVAVALVTLGVVGYGVADAYDVVPGVLTIDDTPARDAPLAAPTGEGRPSGPPTSPVAVPVTADVEPLQGLSTSAPVPLPAAVAKALTSGLSSPALGPSVGASIRDAVTGAPLLERDASTPRTPASTMKLLTAAAISEPLGATTRFTTKVVQGPTPGSLVLVAGGDMMLGTGPSQPDKVEGHAGLGSLASQVATSLKATGVSKVTLSVDSSYAAGPDFAPTWDRSDLDPGYVGKVAMLGLARDLVEHGHPAQLDPSGAAAKAFAAALGAAGVQVTGSPVAGRAPAGATTLGAVESAPAADVLADALGRSDNALMEGLARQAAVRSGVALGRSPFAAVAQWVHTRLQALGYDLTGLTAVDVCGLSGGQKAPARLVSDVLVRGASGKDPALQAVLAGLPVGGLTGTLFDRFDTPGTEAGAGLARAKTGTLTGVSAMAGTVVDAQGRLLTYEIVADKVPPTGTDRARAALDRVISALAACGCRS